MDKYNNMTLEEKISSLDLLKEEVNKARDAYENSMNEDLIGDSELFSRYQSLEKEKFELSNLINKERKFEEESPTEELDELAKKVVRLKNIKTQYDVLREDISASGIDNDLVNKELEQVENQIAEMENPTPFVKEEKEDKKETKEEKKVNEDESPTDKLPKVDTYEISDVNIIFDSKNGYYKVRYLRNGKLTTEVLTVDKKLFKEDIDNKYYKEINSKYDAEVSKNLDYHIVGLLKHFDEKNNTNLTTDYINNTLDAKIMYDFRYLRKIDKKVLSNQDKKELKRIAKEQKAHRKAKIYRFNTKKAAAILLGTSLVAASVGLANKDNKSSGTPTTEITTEEKSEETITDDKTTELPKTEDAKAENTVVEVKEDVPVIEEEDENEVEIVSPNIYDKIELKDDTIMKYDTYGSSPNAMSDKLNCSYYKISLIAIMKDGEFVKYYINTTGDNINLDTIKKECEDSLGGNISLQVNLNGYDENDNKIYSNIGWLLSDDLKYEKSGVNVIKK